MPSRLAPFVLLLLCVACSSDPMPADDAAAAQDAPSADTGRADVPARDVPAVDAQVDSGAHVELPDVGTDAPADTAPADVAADGAACPSGFGDCDHDTTNGCEQNLNDGRSLFMGTITTHCGACDHQCPGMTGMIATCVRGECVYNPRP